MSSSTGAQMSARQMADEHKAMFRPMESALERSGYTKEHEGRIPQVGQFACFMNGGKVRFVFLTNSGEITLFAPSVDDPILELL